MSGLFRTRLASGDIFAIAIKDTVKDGYGLLLPAASDANSSLVESSTLVGYALGAGSIIRKYPKALMNSDTFEHFRAILGSNGVFFDAN